MLPLRLEGSCREANITFNSSFYLDKVSGKSKMVVDKVRNKNERQQVVQSYYKITSGKFI